MGEVRPVLLTCGRAFLARGGASVGGFPGHLCPAHDQAPSAVEVQHKVGAAATTLTAAIEAGELQGSTTSRRSGAGSHRGRRR